MGLVALRANDLCSYQGAIEARGVIPSLLIVDDEPAARRLAGRILRTRYDLAYAGDVAEARQVLARSAVELLVCDINLPGASGLELAEHVRSERPDIGIVLVTGYDDPALAERAFESGVYGYLVKPYRSGDLLITVAGALRRRALEQEARAYRLGLERSLAEKAGETSRMARLLESSAESLERSRLEIAHRLGMAVKLRDGVTGDHIQRLSVYSELLARVLGLEEEMVERIGPAALMHDIGKIAIPDRILLKPGPLTAEERREMQRHPDIGREMLSGSEAPLLKLAATVAWTHHEKWDGTGYPRGISGEQIPIGGRIVAVADVYDALTRDRPYRSAVSEEEALGIMHEGRGSHFDPEVLDAFASTLPVGDGSTNG